MDCVFCDVAAGSVFSHTIYEDSNHIAILDKYPIDRGHTLLIPKKHAERITDMDDDAVGLLFSRLPKISRAILKGTGADSFNIGQNNGKGARQIVPHVHIHIIPRYGETGAVWNQRKIASNSEMEKTAKLIRSSF